MPWTEQDKRRMRQFQRELMLQLVEYERDTGTKVDKIEFPMVDKGNRAEREPIITSHPN